MTSTTQLTLPQIGDLLTVLWTDPKPSTLVMLGAPGLAKTSFARHDATAILASCKGCDREAVGYLEFVAGQRDPSDVGGIALPAKAETGSWHTHYTRSPLLCLIDAKLAEPGIEYLVLNLDEITQCAPDMTKALRGIIDADTRMIGNNPLPDNVYVIATGNRLSDKSGSVRLLSHAANAVFRVEVVFDAAAWAEWAETQGFHPKLIASALALSEDNWFASAVPAEDTQYCTGRSAARLFKPLTQMTGKRDDVVDNLLSRRLAASAIGEAAADQLFSMLSMLGNVPSAKEIQASPETATVSDETHFQHAAAQVALSSVEDGESGERALQYILRLRPDLQISTAAALLRKSARCSYVITGPTVQQFLTKHHDLMPLAEGVVA